MKFFYFLVFGIFSSLAGSAQNSWKVCLNGKTIFSTAEENEEKNVVTIRSAALKQPKDFVISYHEKNKKNKWRRFISLYDDNDHELLQQEGTKFKMGNETLASYFQKSGKIKVYTWSLPTDPKLQAAIRVRRVHLCTLIVE